MDHDALRALLNEVRAGRCSDEEFLARLTTLPFEDIGFAKIDHHRSLRTGYPEVVFGPGKTPEQVAEIFVRLHAQSEVVMATRVDDLQVAAVRARLPDCRHHPVPRILTWHRHPMRWRHDGDLRIAVITAGTADLPVAEEAAVTAETLGWPVDRLFDVGVAGVHRLLAHLDRLQRARVVVVVAGMEGALASVVGGLVRAPVIAVPTSVGYGANFGGLSALLGMLTSCANGVSVVNIDNGYGAGYSAALIAALTTTPSRTATDDGRACGSGHSSARSCHVKE